MATLDRQWAFDTALAGLRAQGRRSIAANGITCLYRGPGGLKCGVGFLIPDERYDPATDVGETQCAAGDPRILSAICPGNTDEDDSRFLRRLQKELHDNLPDNLAGLNEAAASFAKRYGLSYAAPAEAQP